MNISDYFNLNKSQKELDFVDAPIDKDVLLFIDPFAISIRSQYDRWSLECHEHIIHFFQNIINSIRSGNNQRAFQLLSHLREPNEIGFGFSKKKSGSGIGKYLANELLDALKDSSAVKTGFIQSIEECELMIEGISRDKVSDLTTNIIRKQLAEYTKNQCKLFEIKLEKVALPPYYSISNNDWISDYYELPLVNNRPRLFVPKIISRWDVAYNHINYYNKPVLEYLQAEELTANSSLVRTLKNERKVVYKKDIKPIFACTKENLFQFSKDHPQILKQYRNKLEDLEKKGINSYTDLSDEKTISTALIKALKNITSGVDNANVYHNIMIGIVEIIFFPKLFNPIKEAEIHEGRKRIDIRMTNAANSGIFYRLHKVHKIPCPYIVLECKNYSNEVANAELDQLAGRFSSNRGEVGILLCRSFKNRKLFVKRCQDTFKDNRGLIVPIDDNIIINILNMIVQNKRDDIDKLISTLIDEICFS